MVWLFDWMMDSTRVMTADTTISPRTMATIISISEKPAAWAGVPRRTVGRRITDMLQPHIGARGHPCNRIAAGGAGRGLPQGVHVDLHRVVLVGRLE
jgi:hypothetical protein